MKTQMVGAHRVEYHEQDIRTWSGLASRCYHEREGGLLAHAGNPPIERQPDHDGHQPRQRWQRPQDQPPECGETGFRQ